MKMKVVMTIAGSDSSGGAGIQADLKTFEAFGVFGTSAITVLTAQNTMGVRGIYPVDVDFILAQIKAVFDDFEVAAVKIGMLFDTPIIRAVEAFIDMLDIPIVVDPVFLSKAGSPLLKEDAVAALKSLCRLATVVTPNTHEAKALFGYQFGDSDSLKEIFAFDVPILVKNQILEKGHETLSVDQLFRGREKRIFTTPKVDTTNLHGTGCSYSSAIAANLALGKPLDEAIEISKNFIYQALLHAPNIGHGNGPIHHKKGGSFL